MTNIPGTIYVRAHSFRPCFLADHINLHVIGAVADKHIMKKYKLKFKRKNTVSSNTTHTD